MRVVRIEALSPVHLAIDGVDGEALGVVGIVVEVANQRLDGRGLVDAVESSGSSNGQAVELSVAIKADAGHGCTHDVDVGGLASSRINRHQVAVVVFAVEDARGGIHGDGQQAVGGLHLVEDVAGGRIQFVEEAVVDIAHKEVTRSGIVSRTANGSEAVDDRSTIDVVHIEAQVTHRQSQTVEDVHAVGSGATEGLADGLGVVVDIGTGHQLNAVLGEASAVAVDVVDGLRSAPADG